MADRVVVGIGSSATVDGGVGLLQGLGGSVILEDGAIAPIGLPPTEFHRIRSLVLPEDLGDLSVLCDVQSPLLGPEGAAVVYGPQKGATSEEVPILEELVECGAPADILFDSRAHVGTDKLHFMLLAFR